MNMLRAPMGSCTTWEASTVLPEQADLHQGCEVAQAGQACGGAAWPEAAALKLARKSGLTVALPRGTILGFLLGDSDLLHSAKFPVHSPAAQEPEPRAAGLRWPEHDLCGSEALA